MVTVAPRSPDAPVAGAWWRPFASTAGVAVAHVALAPGEAREAQAFARLDAGERESWRRYAPAARRRFALCRAALRSMLCDRLGCPNEELSFGVSAHGKPFAMVSGAPSRIGFNVSHTLNHGLVAIAERGRVGVDVEERVPGRNLRALIEAAMGPDESAELDGLRPAERLRLFYRLWTFKEALVKALGAGFSIDVSRFQVPPRLRWGDAKGTFRFPHLPSVTWGLEEIGGDRFAAALAYELPQGAARGNGRSED